MSDGGEERRGRQRVVTEEPFAIDPDVRGRELATVRRRGVALLLDGVACLAVVAPLLVALAYGVLLLQAPTAARILPRQIVGAPVEDAERGLAELLALVHRRRPGAVPPELVPPLAEGDLEAVERRLRAGIVRDVSLLPDAAEPSYYDPIRRELHVHRDVFFGRLAGPVSIGGLAVLFFTLITWLGDGRSPGKWLLGARVVRLDGRRLRLRDAFDRAGGYAASLSTFGLGFLEARRDPNRQALHDRIAGTVVLREPRRGVGARLRGAARGLWRRASSRGRGALGR